MISDYQNDLLTVTVDV